MDVKSPDPLKRIDTSQPLRRHLVFVVLFSGS